MLKQPSRLSRDRNEMGFAQGPYVVENRPAGITAPAPRRPLVFRHRWHAVYDCLEFSAQLADVGVGRRVGDARERSDTPAEDSAIACVVSYSRTPGVSEISLDRGTCPRRVVRDWRRAGFTSRGVHPQSQFVPPDRWSVVAIMRTVASCSPAVRSRSRVRTDHARHVPRRPLAVHDSSRRLRLE